jgi:hypothetical protein
LFKNKPSGIGKSDHNQFPFIKTDTCGSRISFLFLKRFKFGCSFQRINSPEIPSTPGEHTSRARYKIPVMIR